MATEPRKRYTVSSVGHGSAAELESVLNATPEDAELQLLVVGGDVLVVAQLAEQLPEPLPPADPGAPAV
jgi:hypothetical protein